MNVSELQQHFESTSFLNVTYVVSQIVFRDWNWQSSQYKVNGKLSRYFIIIVDGSQAYTFFENKTTGVYNQNDLLQLGERDNFALRSDSMNILFLTQLVEKCDIWCVAYFHNYTRQRAKIVFFH